MRTASGSSETNLLLQTCLQRRSSGVAEGDSSPGSNLLVIISVRHR